MDEIQDVLDADGNRTSLSKTKQQIFEDNDWRLVVHVWVIDSNGKVILQKRVDTMKIFAGMWDISMGGGVDAGEDSINAAVRELEEELGLVITEDELTLIGRYKIPKFIPEKNLMSNEFSDTYLLRKDVELKDLTLQASEVAAVDKISLDALFGTIEDSEKAKNWVPHGLDYYSDVITKIKNLL